MHVGKIYSKHSHTDKSLRAHSTSAHAARVCVVCMGGGGGGGGWCVRACWGWSRGRMSADIDE